MNAALKGHDEHPVQIGIEIYFTLPGGNVTDYMLFDKTKPDMWSGWSDFKREYLDPLLLKLRLSHYSKSIN